MIIVRTKQNMSYFGLEYQVNDVNIKLLINKSLNILVYIPFEEIKEIVFQDHIYSVEEFVNMEEISG